MTEITIVQRFGRATAVGAAGFCVALAIIASEPALHSEFRLLRVATAGAFWAGLIFARGFGGQGAIGWYYSGMAFGAATVLGVIFALLLIPFDAALMRFGTLNNISDLVQDSLFDWFYANGTMLGGYGIVLAWIATYTGIHAVLSKEQERP